MAYLYYPGCTLKTKAKELDVYARKSMEALGIEVSEPENWQCCGAVYPLAKDEIATKLAAVRVLDEARRAQKDLLTLCSACHHVIKRVNNDIKTDENIRAKMNNYMALETPYGGEAKVTHFFEMLRDAVGFDELKKRVLKPLTGRKIGAYYGCMLLRPSEVMSFDDPENPSLLEDFIRAIGAEPAVFSYRNECCGAYAALEDKEMVQGFCAAVLDSAGQKGAEMLLTACPLCRYNLVQGAASAGSSSMPVYYFTELLAEALGVK